MKYDKSDFLEFFALTQDLDPEIGSVEYSVTSKENITLTLHMNVYEDFAYFTLKLGKEYDLVTFKMDNVVSVTCERNKSGLVRFLFYKRDREDPSVIVIVQPMLELIINTSI